MNSRISQTTDLSLAPSIAQFRKMLKGEQVAKRSTGRGFVRPTLLSAAIKMRNSHKVMWHRPFEVEL